MSLFFLSLASLRSASPSGCAGLCWVGVDRSLSPCDNFCHSQNINQNSSISNIVFYELEHVKQYALVSCLDFIKSCFLCFRSFHHILLFPLAHC